MLSEQEQAALRQVLEQAEQEEFERHTRPLEPRHQPAPNRRRGEALLIGILVLVAVIGLVILAVATLL